MSFKILQEKINAKKNPTVMGLDPKLEYVPGHIRKEPGFGSPGDMIFELNKGLIDACHDLIPAIKPQSAYYEMYGIDGLIALKKTAEYAKSKGLYVILDAKRGDIGATSEAYSAAYLRGDIYDCLTVNPYLGIDGIQPFIDDCEKFDKSIFVLVKTSNKSSGDFQDIIVEGGGTLYEEVAKKVLEWGNADNIGVVIGATYPQQLSDMRKLMKNTFFLVPGFGAQGGAADDVKPAFDENGEGAIVNSSRAIMCAWMKPGDGENFGKYAREEVIRMRDAIMGVIKS